MIEEKLFLLLVAALPGCSDLIQLVPTARAAAVTLFEINNELFSAFARSIDDNLQGNQYKAHSPVYRMKGAQLTLHQNIPTNGAEDIEHFTINGKDFLAVANFMEGSIVTYLWEGGKFNKVQRISALRAKCVEYFTIATRKFLAVCVKYHYLYIYEWKSGSFSKKVQDVYVAGVKRCTFFDIRSSMYMACGTYSWRNQDTTVHKWDGARFTKYQSLRSFNVGRLHSFTAKGTVYLAIPNSNYGRLGPWGGNYTTVSYVYRWNGNKFVLHQSILTHGASAWESFTSGGDTFLAVANRWINPNPKRGIFVPAKSVVYKMVGDQFTPYLVLPPTKGAVDIRAATHNGQQYLTLAVDRPWAKSPVYIWA